MDKTLTTKTAINQLTIDTDAMRGNLEQIRSHLQPNTRIMAIVKSSGYGVRDTATLTRTLQKFGVDSFGVAYTHEAALLRQSGIEADLVVMFPIVRDVKEIVHHRLQTVVSDKEMIRRLSSAAGEPVKVHLHINTGMNRLGSLPQEAPALAKMIVEDPLLKLEGVMTHFASADIPEQDPQTHQQIKDFVAILHELKAHGIPIPWIHAANSAGAVRFRTPECNMVRLGLSLYGIHLSPCMQKTLPLKCALKLTSRLIALHHCTKGETVSYGRTHHIQNNNALIGVIPLGYHDGIHRAYSNRGFVWIKGVKVPMVGTICMDQMMVDVTDVPDVAVGDEVIIFGEEQSPETFAKRGGTIAHELISCLGPRIERVFC